MSYNGPQFGSQELTEFARRYMDLKNQRYQQDHPPFKLHMGNVMSHFESNMEIVW